MLASGSAGVDVLSGAPEPEGWDEELFDDEFDDVEIEGVPLWKLMAFASANLGVTLAWNVEFSLAVPFFQQELELPADTAQKMWIFGPIAGLFVAPLVGFYSDECTSRLGRRRPFIIFGLISILICSTVFANARGLGESVGGDRPGSRGFGQAIGIVAFAFNDFSINVIQNPVRLLASDLTPSWQQTSAQSMQTVASAVGIMLANSFLLVMAKPVSMLPEIFLIANVFLLVTVLFTLSVARERQANLSRIGLELASPFSSYCEIVRTIPTLNPVMIRILVIQVFSWLSYFCCFQILTAWMGSVVFKGSSSAGGDDNALFQQGVAFAGLAVIARAFMQLLTSFLLDPMIRRISVNFVWAFALLVGAVAMAVMAITPIVQSSHWVALVSVALLGVPFAISDALPASLVTSMYADQAKGTNLGILNLSVCLPQLVDTLYTGSITRAYDEGYVIGLGAIYMGIAAVIALVSMQRTTMDEFKEKVELLGGTTPSFRSRRLHVILEQSP